MIDRFLALFADPTPRVRTSHDIRLACAALLVEIMRADHNIADEEIVILGQVVRQLFALSAAEADELSQRARTQVRQSNDLFQFTDVINKHFSEEEKFRLIHGLWQVAYADNQLDKYEEHMVRRMADLLYVPHSQFILARNQARDGKAARL